MKTDTHEKDAAMDMAEDSRQKEWQHPSFVAELFKGSFRWDLISPYPEQDAEDKRIGDEYILKVKDVLEKYIDPEAVDREQNVPHEAIQALAKIGCFGIKIPKEYGGLGFSQTNYNRIAGYISSYCASTSVWISAHQSIGVPQPLKIFGTKEQKQKYMPRLAAGAISAFALTEPAVGSDPAKMTTTAMPSDDGSYYLLNGEKLWCTNGPAAELLIVMAVTPPKIVNGKEKKQITAFVVESSSSGFHVAHECKFMGIRGIRNGLLRFTNVRVPAENIIGKPGDGLKIALTTLNTGRLTVPATCAAGSKMAMYNCHEWVNERVQWGAPIGRHQAVGKKLADIAINTFAMESINALASMLVDRGNADVRLEAAMAKLFCTETAWRLCDDFVQIRGGKGYETSESLRKRGEKPIAAERAMRNARISRIIEGTSEIMKLFIAREAMDPFVSRVMPIMKTTGGLGKKLPAMVSAGKFFAGWYLGTFGPAASPQGVKHLSSNNREHLSYIGRMSKRLARTMFHTMVKFGPKLEFQQLILGAFVDIGTDLFSMAASLSRAEALLSRNQGNDDLQDLVDLLCREARQRISDNFRFVKHNHNRLLNRVSSAYMDGKHHWMIDDVYTELPPVFDSDDHTANRETAHAEMTK